MSDFALNEQGFIAAMSALACIVIGFLFVIKAYMTDSASQVKLHQLHLKMSLMQATAGSSQRVLTLTSFQDFMFAYGKPFLHAAFDVQQMLSTQVRNNFLYKSSGAQVTSSGHDRQLLIFVHSVAEFLGWLEIFRVQMQSIPGWSVEAWDVQRLLEDIKKQLSEHTELQGRNRAAGDHTSEEFDAYSQVMQLHHGEMQAIGSVMLVYTKDASTQFSVRSPMSIDEFLRAVTVPPPPPDAPYHLHYEFSRSFEHKLQVVLSPLMEEAKKLAMLDSANAPRKRLAILQVLICKLIDVLDPAVPWDHGPLYDPDESPPYVTRNERLTPLVPYLSNKQRMWLSEQPYFKDSDPTLSFPGFRADLAVLTQEQRDVHPDLWTGACPRKEPRPRPPRWRKENGHTQLARIGSIYWPSMKSGAAGASFVGLHGPSFRQGPSFKGIAGPSFKTSMKPGK
mmetsp:Transcript_15855/g.34202  ORF Transcript_15855/g.34202 Transcript_15855/m.34202 type:complete len:450 (+) Transcript_15855:113-1462(+)|eukprot:CAMPEP_0202910260 /NCGR_PEP_ID=MMETSP1392-20130828/51572_1 /ASSEMBLY_ACC=CAM_ASM_000868 /TAXON_ID=225041 /ORGANISM="Chlamydomonas chlamydogama, Strain SAG 11-48b" /LENGTH=449 /DNA_ID=CAMNT_0049600319 /DNA_START=44 /DNA_END=1393 /DNA_ORIENTATION=+